MTQARWNIVKEAIKAERERLKDLEQIISLRELKLYTAEQEVEEQQKILSIQQKTFGIKVTPKEF